MLLHAQNLEPFMANHILGTPVKLASSRPRRALVSWCNRLCLGS